MPIGIHRHFAAVRVYMPGCSYHLNYERLQFMVDLVRAGTEFRAPFRAKYPNVYLTDALGYETVAQAIVSNNIDIEEV